MKNQIKISTNKFLNKTLYTILGFVFIIILWIIFSYSFNNSLVIPKISEVFTSFIDIFKESRIYKLILFLLLRIILVTLFSVILAGILAILSSRFEKFRYFIDPIITIFKTIPLIVIIILLFMSIGMKQTPYFATSLVIVPLIYEELLNSYSLVDKSIKDDIKTISKTNLKVIFTFYIPLLMPSIITSFIQSFGLGLKVMMMSEFISPLDNTFGAEIKRYYINNDMAKVYVLAIIAIIFVLIIDKILKELRKKYYN